jgi:hypothetical protein
LLLASITVTLVALFPDSTRAQARSRIDLGGTIEVGGEEERYLRALQIAGVVPLTPWSIQPFSPTQTTLLRSAREQPWASRYVDDSTRFVVLRPRARLTENSTFPYQNGIGPTWEGRGLTGEAQLGVAAALGPLHFQLAPVAFAAENAPFRLATNGLAGEEARGDARFPGQIDLPQRFGTGVYSRAGFGTSSAAIDAFHLFAGISTAPQKWGPQPDFPLVLGPNAGGFPTVFLGTSTPVNLWLFKLHGRLEYGRLTESAEFPSADSTRLRFASGLVLTLVPRGVDGLELGAARFIQRYWPSDVWDWSILNRPFSGIVWNNASPLNQAAENQLGSIFFRWAFPKNRVEIFGEMYREDYPGKFHGHGASLIERPDDYTSIALGLQRAWRIRSDHIRVLHLEIVNGEINHQERDGRLLNTGFTTPLPPYIHGAEVQGHTLNGMLLGSPEAYGGSGWHFGVDDFTPQGRRSFTLERTLRLDWLPTLPAEHPQVRPDVLYALRAELTRFMGKRDITVSLVPALDLNRNLVDRHDVFNLSASVTLRGW